MQSPLRCLKIPWTPFTSIAHLLRILHHGVLQPSAPWSFRNPLEPMQSISVVRALFPQELLASHVAVFLETHGHHCHPLRICCTWVPERLAVHTSVFLDACRSHCHHFHVCCTCAPGVPCIPRCGFFSYKQKPTSSIAHVLHLCFRCLAFCIALPSGSVGSPCHQSHMRCTVHSALRFCNPSHIYFTWASGAPCTPH